jgi:hypothetical protein
VKLVWMIIAGVGVVTAIVLVTQGNLNTAFVAATLGAVAWFLSYRSQMKEVIGKSEEELQDDTKQD